MLLAQLIFCALGFRSLVAGLLFVGVVLMSNTFGMALMSYWGVGLNVNTLPVISLGIGFGEDYGIYIVSRAIEEYQRSGRSDLNRALIDGVATAGKAVLYTAFLISASIAFWAFSPLRFQAEMGSQLLIILGMNMLGGLLLLPALIALLKPKFVTGSRKHENRRAPSKRFPRDCLRSVDYRAAGDGMAVLAASKIRMAQPVMAMMYAPLYFGVHQGFFAHEGFDLEFMNMRTDLAIAALGTGDVDYITHGGAALRAAAQGFPLKLIFALDHKTPFWLVARPQIKNVAQLTGRKIGISFPGDTPQIILKRFLRRQGIDPDRDVAYIPANSRPRPYRVS